MNSALQDDCPASIELETQQQPFQSGELAQTVFEKFNSLIDFITNLQKKLGEFRGFTVESKEIKQTLEKLFAGLSTIDLHFSFLSKVIEYEDRGQVVEKLKVKFEYISGHYENLTKASDISLIPVYSVLNNVVTNIFKEIETLLEGLLIDKKGEKKVKNSKERISQAQILTAKLESILEYFPGLAIMGKDEIFTHPKSSPIWQNLHSVTRIRHLKDKKSIEKSIKLFYKMVILANAVAHKSQEVEKKVGNETLAKIVGFLSGAYYSVAEEKAQTRAGLLFANPSMDISFKVLNLPDHGFVKEVFKLTLPSIEYDNKIYVSRLFPQITKESILKEYELGDQNTITPRDFVVPNLVEQKEQILKTIFDKNPEKVKIRILAPWPLIIRGTPTEKMKAKLSEIKNIFPKDAADNTFKENFNGGVIHVHGGGFVAMSSSAHRNYLIRWAKSLNMVIFSIDYRLAPANPYPDALDDVWQAYNWIINYSESILGIPMDRIVVTGDSAGGNLVASLTLRTIKEGVRVPDGCMLSYPALSLYPKKVIPSYFVAINDNILPYNVLKLCLKAYIPEGLKPESDPFLSPLTASDELLAKMPAVRLITGTDDPLHDDNWQFLHKLQKLNKDVQMTVYEGVPHGFLSLDDLIDYELVIAETVGRLRELFYSVEKKEK